MSEIVSFFYIRLGFSYFLPIIAVLCSSTVQNLVTFFCKLSRCFACFIHNGITHDVPILWFCVIGYDL